MITLPAAYRIWGILYLGRQVFRVDGHSGLWGHDPRSNAQSKQPGLLCHFPERAGRGYSKQSRTGTLYQLEDLTAEVEHAVLQAELCSPDASDASDGIDSGDPSGSFSVNWVIDTLPEPPA